MSDKITENFEKTGGNTTSTGRTSSNGGNTESTGRKSTKSGASGSGGTIGSQKSSSAVISGGKIK